MEFNLKEKIGDDDNSDIITLCLICSSNTSSAISSKCGYQNDNILSNQEQIVFILKHLLQLPSSQLEGYLQTFGNPDQWFDLCDECIQLTVKARELHLKLLRIEKELKEIQRKILETIKSDSTTTEQDNLLHYHHDGQATNLLIWRETRSFVKNESYQDLYLYVKEEPVFVEPERSITPTPSPPPPDDNDDDLPYQIKEELELEDNSDPDSDIISDNNEDNYLPSPSSLPPSSPSSKKDSLLTCDICGKTAFSSQKSLSTHRVRIHKAWKIGPHKKRRKTPYPTDKSENCSTDKTEKDTSDKVDIVDVAYPIKKKFDNGDPDLDTTSNNQQELEKDDNFVPRLPTPKIDKDNLLTCDICGKTAFSSKNSLCVHRRRFHKAWKKGPYKKRRKTPYPTDNPDKCPIDDDKATQFTSNLDPTPKAYSQTYPCPSCSLTFYFGSKWQAHLQTVHNSEELPCFMENCNRKFYRLRLLLSHLKVHRTGKEFVCPNCPLKIFPDQGTLNQHIRMKHNPEGPPPKPDISQLTCEICGSSKFSSITSLGMHRIKVHKVWKKGPKKKYGPAKLAPATEGPPEEHLCDLCGSSFNTKFKLKTHIKLKHEKCYPCHCHLCGKGCTSRGALKMHIARRHKEEAKKEGLEMYSCKVEGCTRCYLSREQYDKHLRENHGDKDKPFKCEECGKAFFWKGRLVRHQMAHRNKGLQCYLCKVCGKGYSIPSYLTSHLRKVHGIKTKRAEGGEICN